MSKLSIGDILVGSGLLIAIDAVLDLLGVISAHGSPSYYAGIIALAALLASWSAVEAVRQKLSDRTCRG